MIKVAIAEDHPLLLKVVVEKLSFFDDIELKFCTINGENLIEKLKEKSNIDVILMDIEMPKMNGIEATLIIKNKFPQIKIIMLTVLDNDENIFHAIKNGADGYLLKEISAEDLHKAIVETINGGAVMTPSIALKTLKLFRNPVDFSALKTEENVKLTSREVEVLEQLSKGLKYDDIAKNLFLSSGTIRKHIENIYTKLQVHNKLEAIQKAKNQNIL